MTVPIDLIVGQLLYLFAPLFFAAACSGLVLRFDLLKPLKTPLDLGATFRGRRLFGDNKTWRGLLVVAGGSAIGGVLQAALFSDPGAWSIRDGHPVLVGALIGVGAVAGELPNSFLKRRLDIAPGRSAGGPAGVLFYLLDQVDLLVLTWPLIFPFVRASWLHVAVSFALAVVLHQLVSTIGYAIGARKSAR